jgi:hypothetical protein
VYKAEDFDALAPISEKIVKAVTVECNKPEPICTRQVEMYWILDNSNSMSKNGEPYYFTTYTVPFVKSVLEMLANEDVKYAFIVYDAKVRINAKLTGDAGEIARALERLENESEGAGTNTGVGIEAAIKQQMDYGSVDAVPVFVILTDGNMDAGKVTFGIEQATEAKNKGIQIFAIGVVGDDGIDMAELQQLGSSPAADYVYKAEDFDALAPIATTLYSAVIMECVDMICDCNGYSGQFDQQCRFAADGKTTTAWRGNGPVNQWLAYDAGTTITANFLLITPYQRKRVYNVRVFYSEANACEGPWIEFGQFINYDASVGPKLLDFSAGAPTARYFRILFEDTYQPGLYVSVSDLVFMESLPADFVQIEASSTDGADFEPSNVFDSDEDTEWRANGSTIQGIAFFFGETKNIKGVIITRNSQRAKDISVNYMTAGGAIVNVYATTLPFESKTAIDVGTTISAQRIIINVANSYGANKHIGLEEVEFVYA